MIIIIRYVFRSGSGPSNIKGSILPHRNSRPPGGAGTSGDSKLHRSELLPEGGDLRHFFLLPTLHNAAPAELPGDHDLHLHQHLLRHQFHGLLFNPHTKRIKHRRILLIRKIHIR